MTVFDADIDHSDHNTFSGERTGKLPPLIGMDSIDAGDSAGIIIEQRDMIAQRYILHTRNVPGLSKDIGRDGGSIIIAMIMTELYPQRFKRRYGGVVVKDNIGSEITGRYSHRTAAFGIELHNGVSGSTLLEIQTCPRREGAPLGDITATQGHSQQTYD